LRASLSETPLCAFCTGFIPDVVVSHANSSRTEQSSETAYQINPLNRKVHEQSIVGSPRTTPLPRGRRGTEPLSWTIRVAIATGGLCREGVASLSMKTILQTPGVLETLNPTDDGTFGKCRNTYGKKVLKSKKIWD
jgi:hypothetical protein